MIDHNIKIQKIVAKKFRCFKEIEVKFGDGNYYSIVGKNGIGKTGLLEAINIAISDNSSTFNNIYETDFYSDDPIELDVEFTNYFFLCFNDGLERLIPCKKFKKTILRRQTKERNSLFSPPYEIKYEYYVDDYSPTGTQYNDLKSIVHTNVSTAHHLVRMLKKNEDGSFEYLRESDRLTGDLNWRQVNIGYGLPYLDKVLFPKIFYFDKDRTRELLEQYNTTISKVINELNWRVKREILKLGEDEKTALKTKYSELHAEIKELDKHKTELVDPVINIVKEKLGISIVDQGLDFYFMDILNPYKGSLLGHKTPQDQIVPVMKYGSGVSSLISLTFLIEFAKQAKECILILVDEPEIHLHPELSKKLKKILIESTFQSILSTHSHLFLDYERYKQNICLDINKDGIIYTRYCNQIDLADVQFKLLGNSLDDLYIPQSLLLVEGKYDKLVISQCLTHMGIADLSLQILDCEGYTDIPNKAEKYKEAIEDIKNGTERYKNYITQKINILVDGDVSEDVITGWKSSYSLDDESVKHLQEEHKSLEYVYPESLIKECVKETILDDGTNLTEKTKVEIIEIILSDDDISEGYSQSTNRVSKSRLNVFIADNINSEILQSDESSDLLEIIKWIAIQNGKTIDS